MNAELVDYFVLLASWALGAIAFRAAARWLFRGGVDRLMRATGGAAQGGTLPGAPTETPRPSDRLDVEEVSRRRRRRLITYLFAGLAQAIGAAAVALYLVDPSDASVAGVFVLAALYAAPASMITVALLLRGQTQLSSAGLGVTSALFGFVFSFFFTSSFLLVKDHGIRMFALLLNLVVAVVGAAVVVLGGLWVRERVRRGLRMSPEMDAVAWVWLLTALIASVVWMQGHNSSAAYIIPLTHAAFWAVVLASFSSIARPAAPVDLLFLRTFDSSRRGETTLRTIARWWADFGRVHLVSGPDTALATLDAGAMRSALLGRLQRRFLISQNQLSTRLKSLRNHPNLDGRFEVETYACSEDLWRPTVLALMSRSTAIIMDIRGLRSTNSGALFELRSLAELGLVDRCIFLVDPGGDCTLVEGAVGAEQLRQAVMLSTADAKDAEVIVRSALERSVFGSLADLTSSP